MRPGLACLSGTCEALGPIPAHAGCSQPELLEPVLTPNSEQREGDAEQSSWCRNHSQRSDIYNLDTLL